ncbi:MAG: hypothetical protein J1F64_06555, partial [Oscillospiraceae bacterium]|nr:hypothetical protein [Oscillospiraceae bacterium]
AGGAYPGGERPGAERARACTAAEAAYDGGFFPKGQSILETAVKAKYSGAAVFERVVDTIVCASKKQCDERYFSKIYKYISSDKNKLAVFNKYFLHNTAKLREICSLYRIIAEKYTDKEDIYYNVYYIRNAAAEGLLLDKADDIKKRLSALCNVGMVMPDTLYIICKINADIKEILSDTDIIKRLMKYSFENFDDACDVISEYIKQYDNDDLYIIELIYSFMCVSHNYGFDGRKIFSESYGKKTAGYGSVFNDFSDAAENMTLYGIPIRAGIYALGGDFEMMKRCTENCFPEGSI